jgi:hypothetical protein
MSSGFSDFWRVRYYSFCWIMRFLFFAAVCSDPSKLVSHLVGNKFLDLKYEGALGTPLFCCGSIIMGSTLSDDFTCTPSYDRLALTRFFLPERAELVRGVVLRDEK